MDCVQDMLKQMTSFVFQPLYYIQLWSHSSIIYKIESLAYVPRTIFYSILTTMLYYFSSEYNYASEM